MVFVCVGLVLGTEELQPIIFRVWAGKEERKSPGGVYGGLVERPGFLDIRAKRKDFADWIRHQDSAQSLS